MVDFVCQFPATSPRQDVSALAAPTGAVHDCTSSGELEPAPRITPLEQLRTPTRQRAPDNQAENADHNQQRQERARTLEQRGHERVIHGDKSGRNIRPSQAINPSEHPAGPARGRAVSYRRLAEARISRDPHDHVTPGPGR